MQLLQTSLRYFEEVARQGSLRKAAERLHVAASAVNRQILKLEAELGVPLFERLPRGLRLSAAGELMLYQIRQWQRDERHLLETLGNIRGAGTAEIRLATVESLTDQLLPTLLESFSQRFRALRLVLETGMTESILEQVQIGDADIGICINPPPTRKVRFVQRVNLEFGVVVAPSHPLAEQATVKLRDCRAHRLIAPSGEMFRGSTLEKLLANSPYALVPVASCNRILTIKSLVRAGLGIAFLNRLDVARELAQGELVFRSLSDRRLHAQLALCVAADRSLPPAGEVLLEHLRVALAAVDES